jgi:hypothetical protein
MNLSLSLLMLSLVASAPAAAAPTARSVVERGIRAQGGLAKVRRLRTAHIRLDGTAPRPQGGVQPLVLEDYWEWPARYRTENRLSLAGVKFSRVMVINGPQVWVSLNGQQRTADAGPAGELREEIYEESVDKLFPLVQPGFQLSLLPGAPVQGYPTVGVKVESAGHRPVELFFDRKSGLLVKRLDHIKDDEGKVELREVFFSDYHSYNGLLAPGRQAAYYDGKLQLEGKVVLFECPSRIAPKIFERP